MTTYDPYAGDAGATLAMTEAQTQYTTTADVLGALAAYKIDGATADRMLRSFGWTLGQVITLVRSIPVYSNAYPGMTAEPVPDAALFSSTTETAAAPATTTPAPTSITQPVSQDPAFQVNQDLMQSVYQDPAFQPSAPPPPDMLPGPLDPTAELTEEQKRLLELAKAEEGLGGGAGTGEEPNVEYGPFTQYLRSRNLRATGGGPAGAYRRSLFDPYASLYGLEAAEDAPFSRLPGGVTRTFGDYLLNRGGAPKDIYGGARDILKQLYALGQTGREERSLDFGTGGEYEDIVPEKQQNALFRLGLRPFFGSAGGPALAGRLPTEREIYSERRAAGAAVPGNFLDYLRDKYNLGRFF